MKKCRVFVRPTNIVDGGEQVFVVTKTVNTLSCDVGEQLKRSEVESMIRRPNYEVTVTTA